eukprot:gene1624-12749_t
MHRTLRQSFQKNNQKWIKLHSPTNIFVTKSHKQSYLPKQQVATFQQFPSDGVQPDGISKEKFGKVILKTLSEYLWPKENASLRRRVILSLGLLVGSKLLNVTVPFIFKSVIDIFSSPIAELSIGSALVVGPISLIVAYGIARAGASLCSELRNAVFAKVAQSSISSMALKVFDHLHNLDLKFHLSRKTGGLSAIIDRGKRGTTFILNSLVFNVIPTIFELSIVCGLLYYNFGIDFSITAFSTILCYALFTISVTSWRTKFRKNMNRVENEASSKVIDSLINYETVKFFGNEKHEANKYNTFLKEYENESIKVQSSLSFLNFGQQFIFTSALTIMMIMTAKGVMTGNFTIGDLVLVNTMLFQLSIPLNFLGTIYREITQAIADMENMFQLLNVHTEVKDKENAKELVITKGEIKFENVSFSYDEKNQILKNVSFTIQPGMRVGICGTSGSGKSTILRLLFRFLNPDSGRILIDDQDISDVTLESLRRFIGVIPQDTVLFNDTIYYNIKYGNIHANDEQIKQVINKSYLKETIERLSDGLNTYVGERGLKLSGGEKQRVAIARTLLKKPKILLCDEATSALDLTTEKNIMSSLYNISEGMTTLMIAHRLSTIQHADIIFVLGESGKILETGNHAELLSNPDGVYSSMWKKQEYEFTN